MVVELREGDVVGRGECEPHELDFEYWRVRAAEIEEVRAAIEGGCTRVELLELLPRGPARNAVDCALFDLEAKLSGRRAWELAGVELPERLETVFTISAESPERMASEALPHAGRASLKLKLSARDPVACVAAVREVAPAARLIVDANQAWTLAQLRAAAPGLADLGVELIEQPLAVGLEEELHGYQSPVPLCADESCLDRTSLPGLRERYGFVNIKLDKAGGLTEALLLADSARAEGFGIMVGCNVGTSWAMAPAMVVAASAAFVDLDGPLLLAADREPGLIYEGSCVLAPSAEVWG
jgi:L-alanine-DL-glutamate epimerase-like enolase superfamily enzyme